MRDPNQKMRFNDLELSLMKTIFADNDDLLYAVRKVLLQFELSEKEKSLLARSLTPSTLKLLRKIFLPTLDPDSPLFQLTSPYIGLATELKQGPELAWPYIRAKDLEMEYLEQQLSVLENFKAPQKPKIILKNLTNPKEYTTEDRWVNLEAWNHLLSYIDSNLQQIKFLAGMKAETVEQTKARLAKNSNK